MAKFTKSPLEEDWNIHDLIICLYHGYDLLNNEFFEGKLPFPVIGYRQNNKCSKHFYSDRHLYLNKNNFVTCHWEIIINLNHLEFLLWINIEMLLHEMVHHWIVENGKYKVSKGYFCHNKEFRKKLMSCGIKCNSKGETLKISNPFISFLKNYGIEFEQTNLVRNIL